MAMNGINLPLAFTAQEAIWQRVSFKFVMFWINWLISWCCGIVDLVTKRASDLKHAAVEIPKVFQEYPAGQMETESDIGTY